MEASQETIRSVQRIAENRLGIPIDQIQAMGPGELKIFIRKMKMERLNKLFSLDKIAHQMNKNLKK